jgi:hypothetical protein
LGPTQNQPSVRRISATTTTLQISPSGARAVASAAAHQRSISKSSSICATRPQATEILAGRLVSFVVNDWLNPSAFDLEQERVGQYADRCRSSWRGAMTLESRPPSQTRPNNKQRLGQIFRRSPAMPPTLPIKASWMGRDSQRRLNVAPRHSIARDQRPLRVSPKSARDFSRLTAKAHSGVHSGLTCALASMAANSACASAISGISGVGEKSSNAGARMAWASAGRPVDW